MFKHFSLALAATLMLTASASFAADVTVHEVYQAAEAGHMQQAQAMMQQVLKDHPNSAKAHYVDAELYAKSGQLDNARRELTTAQRLDPTLGFAKPAALEALQARLSLASSMSNSFGSRNGFPWVYLLLGLGLIAVIALFLRALLQRNAVQPPIAPYAGGYGPTGGMTGGGLAGGMGSGIMGGLATGAAVGAGIVAGEALANHFMAGQRDIERMEPTSLAADSSDDNMGGDDFGVDDSSSWDGGGGGDSDWS